ERHDRARAWPAHQPAQYGAEDRRGQEPERERAGREPARPAELVENRRKHQRERRARVDADAHRYERDGDDHPAVERRQREARWSTRTGDLYEGAAHASQEILLYDPLCRPAAVRAANARRRFMLGDIVELTVV